MLAGVVFMLMSTLVLTEVILRASVGGSTFIASEYSGYALALMTYLSLGFTFKEGAHIRISFLTERLPVRLRRGVEALLSAFAAAGVAVSVYAVWEMVQTSYTRGTVAYTVIETPLYIPQSLILVGLALLFIQLVAYTFGLLLTDMPLVDEMVRV